MSLPRVLMAALLVLAFALTSAADQPEPRLKGPLPPSFDDIPPAERLPVGRWRIEFANGVMEACEIRQDATAFVVEPKRTSGGKVTIKDGAAVIVFADDRVERWTPVGQRMVVEHWYPGNQFPSGKPVLGIAERAVWPSEVDTLRKLIEQLQKKIKELEANRQSKRAEPNPVVPVPRSGDAGE